MYRDRVRRATYEELEEELLNPKLIILNRPIKIPRFDITQNIEDVDFDDFDLNNHNMKTMLDKATQKDYVIQNHDLFPEMYDEIDATGSVMGNREMRTQTKRFTPKGFDIYSSANSSSDKPSDKPSSGDYPPKTPSSNSSEQEPPKKKGFGFFNSREWDLYNRLRTNDNERTQQYLSSSSSSGASTSSALPSNVHHLTQREMARSRSHTSSSGGSRGGKKK